MAADLCLSFLARMLSRPWFLANHDVSRSTGYIQGFHDMCEFCLQLKPSLIAWPWPSSKIFSGGR